MESFKWGSLIAQAVKISPSLFSGDVNGYPLQYSCLGNPMNRRAWQATVHGVTKSQI